MLSACASPPKQKQSIVWPKPPAKARVIYESTLRNQASLQQQVVEDRLRNFATGQSQQQNQILLKPYDIAAYGGIIAVSDSLLSAVHVFDVPRQKLFQIGWRGDGKLSKPLGIAIDETQNIYVTDADLGFVVKFDKQGHYLGVIGKKEDFSRISDVAVDSNSGHIYVLDRGGVESQQHQVVVYSTQGERINTIGRRGHGEAEFNHPNQLVVSNTGELHVLDAGNFRVQVFNSDGKFLRSWGQLGNQLGNLARPRGIALDNANNVYVTDGAFQNYQIFNQNGQLLLNIGSGGGIDQPGSYMLPAGIAIDETNRIYVVDQVRRKIEIFRLLDSK